MSTFKSNIKPSLTLLEKVGFALTFINALRAAALKYIVLSIRASPRLPQKHALVSAELLRTYFPCTNFRQHQALSEPSSDAYNIWIKEKGYSSLTEDICSEEGMEARLLWIGEPWKTGDTDKKVLLYFHGGGFILPLFKGHLELLKFLREQLASYGENVSVACLEYSLGPEKQFPTPLHQAVLALNHLLAAGCSPSKIAIGGDSAGGNLALAVLSHILHPHPQVPKILPLSSPLASAVLISPWVTFDTTADSFRRNGKIDFITAELISYWSVGAMGEGVAEAEIAEDRYHAEAKLAPESWWEGLERVVKFVGMTAGAYETFVDDITELHRKLKEARRELFVAPREVHDALIFDMDAGRPPSEASIKVAEFLHAGFGGP